MKEIRQSFSIAGYNFRLWWGNPRILVTFPLAFILCFLLSDKAVTFAVEHNTTMQLVEVFIWNFGDSNSILLSSVLLVLLFADMPFLSSGTPLYLVRTKRRIWITGQVIYILAATFVYLLFVLVCTVFFSMRQSFTANMWSPTAAILGYTNAGERVAIPALVKTLEMSWPYQSMVSIFFLMLGYTSVMVMLMLLCNLRFGQAAGVVSVLVYSVYGILMQPDTIQLILKLPDEAYYIANVIIGWVSPLNQATYHMHNFGYDKLPRLWQSYLIFFALVVALYIAAIQATKRYQFTFTGTEGYGDTVGTVTLIYENENGEAFQQETTFETTVNRPIVQLQQTDNTEEEKQKAASQWWVSVLILGGVILAAVIGIILVKKRQKNHGGAYL